jgi:hypothetical protein
MLVSFTKRRTGLAAGTAGLLAALSLAPAQAAELCRYAGMTSYSGQVAVRTEASEARGITTLDVTVRLDAKPWWFWTIQYLAQEITTWRAGELQSVAVNNRYIVNGRPSRQQWDVFARGPDGLLASRVQSRSLPEFRRRHPAFAGHWDPGRFGQPWLPDYPAAQPERRPDLELAQAAMPPRMRTPLALAFYWSRWLPDAGGTVPVFMPGWKRDARLDAQVAPAAPQVAPTRWRMALRHPALGDAPSSAEAVVSADHQLLRLSFDVHASAGSGQGWVDRTECQGR